jgi:hypothetical protein
MERGCETMKGKFTFEISGCKIEVQFKDRNEFEYLIEKLFEDLAKRMREAPPATIEET